jgi:hypothetical protein
MGPLSFLSLGSVNDYSTYTVVKSKWINTMYADGLAVNVAGVKRIAELTDALHAPDTPTPTAPVLQPAYDTHSSKGMDRPRRLVDFAWHSGRRLTRVVSDNKQALRPKTVK